MLELLDLRNGGERLEPAGPDVDPAVSETVRGILARVRNEAGAVGIGEQPHHRQRGGAERRAIWGELTPGALLTRVEWHGGEAASRIEVVVDVVGIIRTIPGPVARAAP